MITTLLSFVFLSSLAHAQPAGFRMVEPGVYRGGRPASEASMRFLVQTGVKTVLNLQGNAWQMLPGETPRQIEQSRQLVQDYGLRFVHMPVQAGGELDEDGEQLVLKAVALMENPAARPIYVHCNVGADRTGIVVAAYRILHENCRYEQASREFSRMGALWSPALEAKQLAFLKDLAANPARYGRATRTPLRCPLP